MNIIEKIKCLFKRVKKLERKIEGGGSGGADSMINITHADLLALVNNSGLTPGQQYRITDYVATVDTDLYKPDSGIFYARSNNHAFDIIVTADSVNKLNENVRAIRHEGDTYFPLHTKFEVWKLKYTIFNDSDRFSWALSSGKGVVYQLIDEWNNDLPYDFKSIQFQRDGVWVYTFGGATDDSLELGNCNSNTINAMTNEGSYYLNNNTFGNSCNLNTFGYNCAINTFGDECHSNIFGDRFNSNTFGNGCYLNTFGYNSYNNEFGASFYSNTFGDECHSNTFGDECHSNTFGNYCSSNTFGNYCSSNTFGNSCNSNTLGNDCYTNTLGDNCKSNTLGMSYSDYNISSSISDIDFTNQLSNFTTPPNGNTIEVIKTPTGVVMQQRISASETESFDVVI